jgi:Short C-terminal domain
MNFQTMSKQRKYILIAAAVGIISVFLPWISITVSVFGNTFGSGSTNGFHSYGIVVFLAFAGAVAISLMGDQTKTLDQTTWMIALATGALALIFTIIFLTDIGGFGVTGFGIWISLIASAGVLASAWMFKNPGDTLQGGFDNLKRSMPSGTPQSTTTNTNRAAELEKLIDMRNQGKISEEEYQQLKSKLM